MRNSLSLKFIAGDLSRSRGTTAVLAVLLILCATLMATGAIVMERLVGSMDRLFEAARPPHFLQMHAGGYDRAALERFAADHPQVRDWLIEEMVGLDGSALTWQRPSVGGSGGTTASGDLSDSLIDHLFVSQNATFDLLLDESGAAPRPGPGQVYVPVAVQQSHGLRTGDDLTLATAAGPLRLRIAGAVRDAQMASSLSSGSRFLISPSDLRTLQRSGSGSPEIIVEYRTADPSGAVDLQRAYESDPATPKNGQAVTFQMIRMINAFGDGLVAVALIMVSLVLIAISMLVLRFVIRGTLEDEVREIGALRAIGLSSRAVSGLYLAKYGVIATAACLVGGLLAVVLSGFLVRGVQTSYLAAPAGLQTVLVPLGALALVDLMVIALCHRVLREVRRLDVVEALVRGELSAARRPAGRPGRSRLASARGGLNVRLTLIDLAAERGRWLLVATVLALSALLVILPMNLLSTFQSPRFVTYMGMPASDLRADIPFSDGMDAVRARLEAKMRADRRLTDVRSYARVRYEVRGEKGWEAMTVEVGEHSASGRSGSGSDGIAFISGGAPAAGQIALSAQNAERYGLGQGDALTLRRGSIGATELVVSGIYQDVTSGGRTAKMSGPVTGEAASYVLYADLAGGADADARTVSEDLSRRVPGASVIPVDAYVGQTLFHVTRALRGVAGAAAGLGIGVSALVVVLVLRLHLVQERRRMGALSAVGFSIREILGQLRGRALIAILAGTAAGLVLAGTGGQAMIGSALGLAGLGITHLDLIPNPWLVDLAVPLALIAAGGLPAIAVTSPLRHADTGDWLTGAS